MGSCLTWRSAARPVKVSWKLLALCCVSWTLRGDGRQSWCLNTGAVETSDTPSDTHGLFQTRAVPLHVSLHLLWVRLSLTHTHSHCVPKWVWCSGLFIDLFYNKMGFLRIPAAFVFFLFNIYCDSSSVAFIHTAESHFMSNKACRTLFTMKVLVTKCFYLPFLLDWANMTNSSIHSLHPSTYPCQGCREDVAYPRYHRARGGIHPGQVTSQTQG